MPRKYNTKHEERGTSNYPNRPGTYRIGNRKMEDVETLRRRQANRTKATCSLPHVHDDARDCNGQPWYTGQEAEGLSSKLSPEEKLLTEVFAA